MTNLHEERARSTGKEDWDFKIQFVVYEDKKYVEIVPISKSYYGKAIKKNVLKFKDKESWLNFIDACTNLETWINKESAWQIEQQANNKAT